jgi:hypothetical protein
MLQPHPGICALVKQILKNFHPNVGQTRQRVRLQNAALHRTTRSTTERQTDRETDRDRQRDRQTETDRQTLKGAQFFKYTARQDKITHRQVILKYTM